MEPLLIIGLGNPGPEFIRTRHNAGFMALDTLAANDGFPEFSLAKKYESLVSEKDGVVLAKPQTFMNESGRAAQSIVSFYKLTASRCVVVHDDLDLPLGTVKMAVSRGSAGHKGVESVIRHIGNDGLVRVRIGICPISGKPSNTEQFVIKTFTEEEQPLIKNAASKAADLLDFLLKNGIEKTMNEYHGRNQNEKLQNPNV